MPLLMFRKEGSFMALENKLGITDSAELARKEERISKQKAVRMTADCFIMIKD